MKYGTLVRIPDTGDLRVICEEKFSLLRQMGMDSCQLVYKPEIYTDEDADTIREAAEKNGIEISAQFCGFRDNLCLWDNYFDFRNAGINIPAFREYRLRYLFSAIPFLKRLGITDMIVHAGFIPNDPFSESYAEMVASVGLLARELKNAGLNLLFETGAESPVALLRLIEDVGTGNLFVNLDTGNLILYGYGNPVDAMYTFGQYVRNVHAKDGVPPTDPRHLGKEKPIGEGFVDFPKVFQMLRERGYDRFITIERELTGGDQNAEICRAMNYLKTL